MLNLLKETISYVVHTLVHNAPVLAFGILVAAVITVYVDPEKLRKALMKKAGVSITGSVAFGAFTPFCACGTMAVIVSMMTTALPWGPIMAFLTSSPLMSPDGFILLSGIVSFKFAVALTAASIIVGICSGYITHFIEKKTRFLENQARFTGKATCCGSSAAVEASCCTQETATIKGKNFAERYKLKKLFNVFYEVGVKRVLLYFAVFAAIGFLIDKYVPEEIIMKYLGSGNIFAVPVLAPIGLPLYVSGSSSIPIINALMTGGASQGALLAYPSMRSFLAQIFSAGNSCVLSE
jgi:uncharacterized membrane protein YraQ (UPF0718 family)